jgi:signal peptidase I
MSFALLLLLCVVITGLISLVDICYFSKRRQTGVAQSKWIEHSRGFFPVFLLVFLLRSFLVEPFRIPSGSLEPTLLIGDFVAVNKYSYGLRFPVWDKKFVNIGEPKRGDIVVFSWPPETKYDYIKRVVGLPGDKISYHDKKLTINGVKARQSFVTYTSFVDQKGKSLKVAKYMEDFSGKQHAIYVNPDVNPFDIDITVPKGHYFMMGDNRDNSSDSRYWGFVAEKNIRGKAFLVWMSWNGLVDSVRWSRIGKTIL